MRLSHQSTCRLIRTRTLARTKKPLLYPASGIGYSQLQTYLLVALQTSKIAVGGDSILPVDETADNRSNVFHKAINAADEAVSDTPDTCQTPEIVSQSVESLDKTHVAPTAHTGQPRLIAVGRPKRTHRLPQ